MKFPLGSVSATRLAARAAFVAGVTLAPATSRAEDASTSQYVAATPENLDGMRSPAPRKLVLNDLLLVVGPPMALLVLVIRKIGRLTSEDPQNRKTS